MIHGGRRHAILLFLGDIVIFSMALWLTLLIRYQELPGMQILREHAGPFSLLFGVWALVFYMSGLYGKRIVLFKTHLAEAILKTQFFNIVIAALFFFLVPGVGIAPKTNLLIYLGVSLVLISLWRLFVFPRLTWRRRHDAALLIASGPEADELVREVNENARYQLEFALVLTPEEVSAMPREAFGKLLEEKNIVFLIADTEHPLNQRILSSLYSITSIGRTFQFLEFAEVYEEVFDRIPLSLLAESWFLKNVSPEDSVLYIIVKRTIDLLGGVLMGVVTLLAVPFVLVSMRLEGPGPLFITQSRIGRDGTRIRTYKFRSMRFNDAGSSTWVGERAENHVTRTGAILRRTSLDEFPQFLNILRGELSLIGPRNDIEGLAKRLAEELPYYMVRYIVKPGITGWAQINQQYEQGNISPQSIVETKTRLAYDFYYLKNRSLALDIVIALKTVKRMFFRVSSW